MFKVDASASVFGTVTRVRISNFCLPQSVCMLQQPHEVCHSCLHADLAEQKTISICTVAIQS